MDEHFHPFLLGHLEAETVIHSVHQTHQHFEDARLLNMIETKNAAFGEIFLAEHQTVGRAVGIVGDSYREWMLIKHPEQLFVAIQQRIGIDMLDEPINIIMPSHHSSSMTLNRCCGI